MHRAQARFYRRVASFVVALGTLAAVGPAALSTSALAVAPPVTSWVSHTTNNSGAYQANLSTSALPDGSSVSGGQFRGTNVDFGGGITRTSANSGSLSSAFTWELNPDGTTKWVVSSTGPAGSAAKTYGVSARPDGTSVIGGTFSGNGVDLGDGVSRVTGAPCSIFASSAGAGFIMGLNADGSVAWTKTPGGAVSCDALIRGVDAIPGGGSVVTGQFWGTNVDLGDGVLRTSAKNGAKYSAFTMGLDANGATQWVVASSAPASTNTDTKGWGVSATSGGAAIVTGGFQGADVDLGDGILRTSANSGAGKTLFTMSLNADGTIKWVKTSTAIGASNAEGYAVDALPDGTSSITGYFRGASVDLGDSVQRTSSDDGIDNSAFTMRLNADGTTKWVVASHEATADDTCYGGYSDADGEGASIINGGVTIVGGTFCGSNANLGDGGSYTSANNGYNYSAYVMAIDGDGTVLWTRITSDPNPFDFVNYDNATMTWGWQLSALPDGSVFSPGSIYAYSANSGPVDFGNGFSITETASTAYTWKLSAAPFAAPMNAQAVAGDTRATISWDPVQGPSITSYTVTAGPGGKTCTVNAPATTCTIDGLANGTEYTFTVVANNAQGSGPGSTAVTATPDSPPTPTWTSVPTTPVPFASSSPLNYTVTFNKSVHGLSSSSFTNTGTATGCVITTPVTSGQTVTSAAIAVTGCSPGTVILTLAANAAVDAGSATGPAAPSSAASVTILQAATPTISIKSAAVAKATTLTTVINPSAAGAVTVTATLNGVTVCTASGTALAAGRKTMTCSLSEPARLAIRTKGATLIVTAQLTVGGVTVSASKTLKVARCVEKKSSSRS